MRRTSLFAAFSLVTLGCPGPTPSEDAGAPDAIAPADAGVDTGPPVPASTAHCRYEALPAMAGAGEPVAPGSVTAGIAEADLRVPVSVTLGAYTGRSENAGGEGFVDMRREPIAGGFATSVGIETQPRIRVLALSTGQGTSTTADDDTLVLIKADLGVGYQGLVHAVEQRLGPAFAGKVIVATSHSHSSFANYSGHGAMQVAFGSFRRVVFDRMVDDIVSTAQAALANRQPARVGIALDDTFDPSDSVSRDRRSENNSLPNGNRKDTRLYVVRVDDAEGEPLALLPFFGMHGTIHGAHNMLASTESTGGIERVLEEHFAGRTLVMHVQGAGGDVSPTGLDATLCPEGRPMCHDYARAESLGHRAAAEILAAWTAAGEHMTDTLAMEVVSRSIERGPDWENFRVRDGALEYAPFDLRRTADGQVFDGARVLSPIDEFNAPRGAALCGQDLGVVIAEAAMPGTQRLAGSAYRSCHMLVPRTVTFFEALLDVEIGETPVCDTTRTTLTAVHLTGDAGFGEYVLSTIPGEPMTILAERMRELAQTEHGVDPDRLLIVGYAQDNNGYVMTAEDWLSNGYEPSITFWGPLDGEMIMERAVDLIGAVLSPTRDDGYVGGTHVAVPRPTESWVADEATLPGREPGTIPAASPTYLATRMAPTVPTQIAEGGTVERLRSLFLTWIGGHPLHGTPEVHLERREGTTWVPVTRASGRVVEDGELLLTWTPDPLQTPAVGSPGRTHYWTVEWQAVPPVGQTLGIERMLSLPLGRYRIVAEVPAGAGVAGTTEYAVSREFVVAPATLSVEVSRSGGDATITVSARAPEGFRLLDATLGANRAIPLRGMPVTVRTADGMSRSVTLDAEGRATLAAPAGSIAVEDANGNRGSGA